MKKTIIFLILMFSLTGCSPSIVTEFVYMRDEIPNITTLQRPQLDKISIESYDVNGSELYCGTHDDITKIKNNEERLKAVITSYEEVINSYQKFYYERSKPEVEQKTD